MAEDRQVKILVVDDDDVKRYTVVRVLRSAGFDYQECATGGECLIQANTNPDLIILDVRLPDINGFEVCRQLKANPATARIPVLQLSATFIKSTDRVIGLDSGADAYLTDSAEPLELVATINALLRIRRAEEAASALARQWQATFDAVSDGICLLDRDGKVVRCNKGKACLLERQETELVGRTLPEVLPPGLFALQHSFPSNTCPKAAVSEVLAGDRWFRLAVYPLTEQSDTCEGCVCVLSDITARKAVELERDRLLAGEQMARTEAERISNLKDEFLATLSHELRTPLGAILGWAQLLRRGAKPDDLAEGLEAIERNAWVQSQLVEDLLDMSRIISGKVRLDIQSLDFAAVLTSAMETVRPTADAKQINFELSLDPDVPPLSGDPNRLQQVLWNLLSNAIKFTPNQGRVRVTTRRLESQVEISVQDTGEGIASEFLGFVFERFRQADASTTRKHSGLGLGLAIVKQLVELHGGTVKVQSPGLGQGSTFTVRLPLISSRPAVERPEPKARTHSPGLSTGPLPELNGIKVLLVDDEHDARNVMVRILASSGAVVFSASSVVEALEIFARFRPDVLVSDVAMPEQDGYDFIRAVRGLKADQGSATPAIALTAFARGEDRQRALQGGFQVHLAKPVQARDLLANIVTLAGNKSGS